ncbi:MAG: rhomboid family protein [Verrucomicrobiota bacterium]
MASIVGDTTCVIHPDRVAVARCPSCNQFFCAECITEHEGQMICAECLNRLSKVPEKRERRRIRIPIAAMTQWIFAALVVWLLFYLVAQTIGDMPDEFHDGTIWE